jgi:2-octaprenyl-6-methoxyphenol hydroxylase
MTEDYDLVISGAGLVGTSLAAALQNSGFRIAILETHLPETSPVSIDSRPLSLCYASQKILETLGLWQEISSFAQAILQVHVSEQHRLGALHFRASEENVPALGYVVPMDLLQKTLYQRCAQIPSVKFISLQKLMDVQYSDNGLSIKIQTMQGERNLKSPLLVIAEGTHSSTRELLGIKVKENGDDWCALTACVETSQAHQGIAYERFIPQGVLAVLPLKNPQHCRAVWAMPKAISQTLTNYSDIQLAELWQRSLPNRLGDWRILERSHSFPLQTLRAEEQIRQSVVLLGNAAHTLYPLAAQGFNLGLRDACALAELLLKAQSQQQSVGDKILLQSYLNQRLSDQRWIAGLTYGVSQLFDLQIPGLGMLRGLGLLAADLTPFVKHRLAKRLMGISGRNITPSSS